ncbi:tripartite tricarboxylate transporter substrate binding protein [Aureimonas fodinaquatilis]|uniref:Tripartite tricarboxylate transporter substrate binding protein n=1 Tax=Aureimonas fodinaquatilis TaxID=2565783 RepID=A0A5B0E0L9_9HYPH|nr:tripartite tricarboxylate transporter substrate binding protein [Aureimonas fodinaquatilis]KAA0972617.1 tripartite tricarboxylate transporter substrate binding protein [Aureimonas fodinaquatilis]
MIVYRKYLTGLCASVAMAVGLTSMATASENWPERRAEFICATSPGSGAAQWCQLMGRLVGDELGQPVEVVFRAGGNGNEAAEYVANRPADGYTWLQRNSSFAGYMGLPTFRPDPNQFLNIVDVEKFLYVVAVSTNSPYETFEDVIEDMKARPGVVTAAGGAIGSAHHIHLLKLFEAFDVEWSFVPYQGSGEPLRDTLGGHLDVAMGPPGIWQPHVENGAARMLLLLNEEQVELPGIGELRVPADLNEDYEFSHQIQGVFVKEGTPDDIQSKIQDAFERALESDGYKEYLANNTHVVPAFSRDTEANTARFHQLREEIARYLKESGLTQ